MRFLFVGYFATKGGSAMATIPLALRLREEGHKVTFAHWSYPAHIELFTEADLFHVSLHEKRSLISKIFYLTQIAIHHDIILAVSELTITYACQIAGWLSRRPVCAEIQVNLDLWIQSNSSSLHLLLSRWFYPKLQAVRCVAQGLAEFAVTELKIDPKKFLLYTILLR